MTQKIVLALLVTLASVPAHAARSYAGPNYTAQGGCGAHGCAGYVVNNQTGATYKGGAGCGAYGCGSAKSTPGGQTVKGAGYSGGTYYRHK